jgi:hypothetical protein
MGKLAHGFTGRGVACSSPSASGPPPLPPSRLSQSPGRWLETKLGRAQPSPRPHGPSPTGLEPAPTGRSHRRSTSESAAPVGRRRPAVGRGVAPPLESLPQVPLPFRIRATAATQLPSSGWPGGSDRHLGRRPAGWAWPGQSVPRRGREPPPRYMPPPIKWHCGGGRVPAPGPGLVLHFC